MTLAVLALVTIFLAAGVTMRAPQAGSSVFLSDESDVAAALTKNQQRFGDSGQQISATLWFRGDVLTPQGLDQIARAIERVTADPEILQALAETDAVVAPTQLFAEILGSRNFARMTETEVAGAGDQIRSRARPANPRMSLEALIGTDSDGSPVAIASVRLRATEGPLSARNLSPALIDDEAAAATGSTMVWLMGLALVVIAIVTFLFTHSGADLILTMLSLIIMIIWILGAQGRLGPQGLSLLGPPNTLTSMVPVMLIGLAVDYAIQTVALNREQRHGGQTVRIAGRAVIDRR